MQHSIDWENVSNIDSDPHAIPRKIREAIYIKRHADLMNRDKGLEISHLWNPLLFCNV